MRNRLMLTAGVMIIMILCGLAVLGQLSEERNMEASIADVSFVLGSKETSVSVACQRDREEESYHLFLPSYAGEQTMRIRIGGGRRLKLGEEFYSDGDKITFSSIEQIYEAVLYNKNGEETENSTLHVMHSKNLPAVFVHTSSGNMDYIYADKDNKEAGYVQVMTQDGAMSGFDKLDYITGRGNTSWEAQKKAFGIKFKDKVGFLGMDAAKSWALIANYYDGAYVRNMVGMAIAKTGGIKYTPDAELFDLYLNGEYAGLYQAMEKVEIGAGRLDIDHAFLLEFDYPDRALLEEQYFLLPNKKPIVIHSPKNLATWDYTETSSGQWEKDRVYTLPVLLEEEWPAEEETDLGGPDGWKAILLNEHVYVTSVLMLAAFLMLFVLDRKKNGK